MDTDFPATMVAYLDVFRQGFPAQPFVYFRGYLWAVAMWGTTRKCMTNMARTCVFVERHLASWERLVAEAHGELRGVSQRVVHLLLRALGCQVQGAEALLAAVETTLIPTVRGKRPGVQTWHDHRGNPARGAALVGHHWALIGLISAWGAGYLGWPVLARLLPGQLNPLGFVAGAGGVQRLDFWLVVIALVRELRQYGGPQPLRGVAEAYVSQASFLNPWVAEGITGISRLRKDAVGWDDPAPIQGKRPRGRPRQKGQAWQLAHLLRVEPVMELTVRLDRKEERRRLVWRDVWLRDVPQPVRVVGIATQGEVILWVSTDVPLAPAVISPLYAARCPMELALRDLKQSGGLGAYHCWTRLASHRFGPLALTACCLWRLMRLQAPQAPGLTAERATPAGELSPLRFPRLHRVLRRWGLQPIVAASAPSTDAHKTHASDEPIVRLAASHQNLLRIPRVTEDINFCKGIGGITNREIP